LTKLKLYRKIYIAECKFGGKEAVSFDERKNLFYCDQQTKRHNEFWNSWVQTIALCFIIMV